MEAMQMKIRWKLLIPCVLLPLAVGALSAWLTRENMALFDTLRKPPLAPPRWLFPVAWTLLYALMGTASYLVLTTDAPRAKKRNALALYAIQLAVNFFWPILFFTLSWYLGALAWLVLLWVCILATLLRFSRIRSTAGDLLLPYLIWTTFAAYLNWGIYRLNP